jgi:hypothetical protein
MMSVEVGCLGTPTRGAVMAIHDDLLSMRTTRFAQHGLRTDTAPDVLAVFPMAHPDVGDLRIGRVADEQFPLSVDVMIGDALYYRFDNFDPPDEPERSARLTKYLAEFLDALFADRLLFWKAVDGGNGEWRTGGDTADYEPLVTDNRTYRRYVWSHPLPVWQAAPAIVRRGRIRDERDYQILVLSLDDEATKPLEGPDRDAARRLVAEYQRSNPA